MDSHCPRHRLLATRRAKVFEAKIICEINTSSQAYLSSLLNRGRRVLSIFRFVPRLHFELTEVTSRLEGVRAAVRQSAF